jgi:hypothetical protein
MKIGDFSQSTSSLLAYTFIFLPDNNRYVHSVIELGLEKANSVSVIVKEHWKEQ